MNSISIALFSIVQLLCNFCRKAKITEREGFRFPEGQVLYINLVDKIFSLTQSPDFLQNQQKQAKVKEYEKQIDQLVYELYDLTEDEIKIVEESTK